MQRSENGKIAAGILILIVSIVGALGLAEGALRVIGFSFPLYLEKIEFGYPDPKTMVGRYEPDPDLFWVTKDYNEKIDKFIKSPPMFLLLGDSCTEFSTYDQAMMYYLLKDRDFLRVSVGKIGTGGYSSYQGLAQMKRDVLRIHPDYVTIYFGWNDHWIGFGIQDKEIAHVQGWFTKMFGELRVVQLGAKAYLALTSDRSDKDHPVRVSLEDFKKNLTEMVRLAQEQHIVPVLLTAPSSHVKGKEPPYLKRRWIKDLSDLVPLHQSYVAAVREVAAAKGAVLCDLEKDFHTLPQSDLEKIYFKYDGIHFTQKGSEKLAEFLVACLRSHGIADSTGLPRGFEGAKMESIAPPPGASEEK